MTVPGGMMDGYIGGIASASFIPQNPRPAFGNHTCDPGGDEERTKSPTAANRNPWFNRTDEDKMVRLSTIDVDAARVTNINKTEEYNVGYAGLSILPWEEFAFNPRVLNELFYQERTNFITYDPEEVNVFFHGKNVMPPTVGDVSENGKSWNLVVDTVNDLRKARQWLTEKCSVFGVTLVYQEGRFGKKKRAPCLVMMDPSKGSLGDKIYTTITRAMDSLHRQRRFCVEINLNGCVERWCRRVLLMDCKAVGARLIITNGEEYSNLNGAEDVVCCVICLPLWLLQAGVYKLHRKVVYDDFFLNFDADDLFLHGTFQDAVCQRQQIFHSTENGQVFRIRSAGQTNLITLNELGSFKFVSVKKYKKNDDDPNGEEEGVTERMKEHRTMTFNELVMERKEKVMHREQKLLKKVSKSTYPKTVDNPDANANVDGKDKKAKGAKEVIKDAETENVTYSCCDASDDESMAKSPRIPEVSSVFFNEAADGSDFTTESDEENGKRIFSPKLKNPTSMSLNNALFDSTDFEARDSVVQPFKAPDADDVIDDDSETDEEEESNVNQKNRIKNDLLNEMSKIESTLPAITNESKFAAKNLESITAEEKSKKEKSEKKKKRKHKNKPAVGKVLKDLMKTTEKTDDAPSAEDQRYKNALSNLNKKSDPKRTIPKIVVGNDKDIKEALDKNEKTIDDVQMLPDVEKLSAISDTEDNPTNESRASKYEMKETTDKENDMCDVEQFTADNSSTDGDDVEMLYQSDRTEKVRSDNKRFFIEKPDNHLKVFTPKTVMSKPLDDDDSDTVQDFQPATDEAKLEIFALNSNRNAKFNSSKLFETPTSAPSFSYSLPVKSASQAISVQDAEDCEDEIEEVQNVNLSADRVESPTGSGTRVPPLKIQFATSPAKNPKRGAKQYNSNRKYLGASVPGSKKKKVARKE